MTDQLKKEISDKIRKISSTADEIPGVVIIHDLPDFTVRYMSARGLRGIGQTLEEVTQMSNKQYHDKFFNPEDASDYVPKIFELLERNTDEVVYFFQQVRTSSTQEWDWYMRAIKILLRDEFNKPVLTITVAMQIDPGHHITSKVSRLLEENNFLRKNYEKFGTLTAREKQGLSNLALGKTSAEVSRHLNISVATAETHRKNIKRKLDISSSYDLSMYARAFDLI